MQQADLPNSPSLQAGMDRRGPLFLWEGHDPETRGPDAAFWNYSYKVTRFNEYCAIVLEGEDCTKKYVVR